MKKIIISISILFSIASFAEEQCYISAYNLQDGRADIRVWMLSDDKGKPAATKDWKGCKKIATDRASEFSELWDDNDMQFDAFNKHLIIHWEFDDAYAFSVISKNSEGKINKHTRTCEIGNKKGVQLFLRDCSSINNM